MRGVAQARGGFLRREIHRHAGGAQHLPVRDAVLGPHALYAVRDRRDAAGGEHRRQERRGRQRAVVAVVGVADVEHLVHRRGGPARRVADRVEHAEVFVVGLALHAQRDEKYPGLHRIDLSVEHQAHAGARLFARDVLAQLGSGGDALEDRVHQAGSALMASPRFGQADQDALAFQPHRIGPEIFLRRLFQHLAGADVEAAAVQRALDQLALEHARRERSVFVRAGIVHGTEAPVHVGEQDAPAAQVDALHRSGPRLACLACRDEFLRHPCSHAAGSNHFRRSRSVTTSPMMISVGALTSLRRTMSGSVSQGARQHALLRRRARLDERGRRARPAGRAR